MRIFAGEKPRVATVRQPASLFVHAHFRLHSETFALKTSPNDQRDFSNALGQSYCCPNISCCCGLLGVCRKLDWPGTTRLLNATQLKLPPGGLRLFSAR